MNTKHISCLIQKYTLIFNRKEKWISMTCLNYEGKCFHLCCLPWQPDVLVTYLLLSFEHHLQGFVLRHLITGDLDVPTNRKHCTVAGISHCVQHNIQNFL